MSWIFGDSINYFLDTVQTAAEKKLEVSIILSKSFYDTILWLQN